MQRRTAVTLVLNMSSVIRWDAAAAEITVGATMELYDLLAVELKQRGYTLPSMSVPAHGGLTIGGTVTTAAHGMNSRPGQSHVVSKQLGIYSGCLQTRNDLGASFYNGYCKPPKRHSRCLL